MPTINNPGNVPVSFNWVLTLTATASTIRFTNNDEDEPPLIIQNLTVGNTVVVQGAQRMVIRNGTPSPALVQPGSTWPALLPGENSYTLTGATGTLTFTPEYL